jgi:dinuclear metal center YbgI/SA1388 family protein
MLLSELRDYIGTLLETAKFQDYSPNGLQIAGREQVMRIATGVTASQRLLEAAYAWNADAILVHHGYFWRGEDPAITGIKKRRVALLLKHEISLLAYHLPLDAHAGLGNNSRLAKLLGITEQGRFGEQYIACYGELVQPKTLGQFAQSIRDALQREPQVIGDPERAIRRIAWCSGAAQGYFQQAIELGVEAYLTGEISEQNVHVAEETGVAFIAAGHHATERYGVQALGEHLANRFGLQHRYFDMDVPV